MNIDEIIKNLQESIINIKKSNRDEMNKEIASIKEKYNNKTKQDIEQLKKELKKARYKKFYNETYGIVEKKETKRDIVALELFNKQFTKCNNEEKKKIKTILTKIYRKERKMLKKN